MKLRTLALMFGLLLSMNASASWFGNNNGNNGWGNDWPIWTPMYWMEEMSDSWDDNGNYGNGYGYNNPYSYGQYGQPYARAPYPNAAIPAPVAPKAPAQTK